MRPWARGMYAEAPRGPPRGASFFFKAPHAGVVPAALTPGDFAVVRRKVEILGKLGEPESLAGMLRAECNAKPDRPRPIGFRP